MKSDYIYFIRIGAKPDRLFKIGTTNNVERRMREHRKKYGKPIEVLWISKPYSKFTTLRVEEETKRRWRELDKFQYIRNDRFVIPENVNQVTIKVRKEWVVSFD